MGISPFKTVKNSIGFWYLSLIVGLLYVAVGMWVFPTPLSSYLALALLFPIWFLASGISEFIYSFSDQKELDSCGRKLAFGLCLKKLHLALIVYYLKLDSHYPV